MIKNVATLTSLLLTLPAQFGMKFLKCWHVGLGKLVDNGLVHWRQRRLIWRLLRPFLGFRGMLRRWRSWFCYFLFLLTLKNKKHVDFAHKQ